MASTIYKNEEVTSGVFKDLAQRLKAGVIAVIPTDTIYGIVGPASNSKTVEKIYKLRKRNSSKPMIILISSLDQITDLGVKLDPDQKEILSKLWPNPISIVLDAPLQKLSYLHRGKKSLAFRMPDNEFLKRLLKTTGPLVAPSANFEGEEPAKNIEEAKEYFNDSVEFYIDNGTLKSPPSTVVKLEKSTLTVLREGVAKIPKELLK